ncbi:hypothetical protein AOLI_G00176650 [Acnodon oligacanthus]
MVADAAQCSALSASASEDSGEMTEPRIHRPDYEISRICDVSPASAFIAVSLQDGWRGQALGVIFWEALVRGSEGTLRARAAAGVNVLTGLCRSDRRIPSCWELSVNETRCLIGSFSRNRVDSVLFGAEGSVWMSCIRDHVLQSTQWKSQEQKSF